MRDAVAALLGDAGFLVSGEADDLEHTVDRLSSQSHRHLDIIIIDASFCGDEPDAVRAVREVSQEARIIILAHEADVGGVSKEQIMEADGFLTFGISAQSMIHSLRLIQMGERVVPRELMHSLLSPDPKPETIEALGPRYPRNQGPSPREAEILHYLLRGDSNKMIARELGITEATVKVHLKGLLRKIRVCNRTQAAIWAMNNGFSFEKFRSQEAGTNAAQPDTPSSTGRRQSASAASK